MIYEIVLIIVLLIALVFASISDLKTREVPNWLTFSLIIIGLSLSLFKSISFNNYHFIWLSTLGALMFFVLGNIMTYTGQWGGGDAKLMMGVGSLIPTYPLFLLNYFKPNLDLNFLFIITINIFIVGSLYGLIYTFYLIGKNKTIFNKQFKKDFKENRKHIYLIILISIFFGVLLLFITSSILAIITSLFLLFSIFLIFSIKSFEKVSLIKSIKVSELTEGDWVLNKIKYKNKVVYTPEKQGITKKQLEKLKRFYPNIRIKIKDGLPFIPGIALGIIATLIWGNIIGNLIG